MPFFFEQPASEAYIPCKASVRRPSPYYFANTHQSRMRQNQTTQIILWFRSAGVARSVLATHSLNLIGFSPVSRSNIVPERIGR